MLFFGCIGNLKIAQKTFDIDYKAWKIDIIKDFSNMLSVNTKQSKPKNVNKQMIQSELSIIDTELMYKNWKKIENENPIKKWKKVILIYHFLEGEVNQALTTFVFIGKNDKWGMTYDHNINKYFGVKLDNISDIVKIKPTLHGGGNGLGIISEFDKNMINIKNVLVVGVSYSEELAPLMKIYDERIFD
jgi:hypothetical protein